MAEYLIQDTTLTAIADEVRTLSDSTENLSPTQMTTELQSANVTVTEQASLIEQIKTALEGKAAGGSSGIETCTVNSSVNYYWTINSELSLFDLFYAQDKTYTHTILKGTFLLIPIESASFPVAVSPSSAVEFLETVTYSGAYHNWYKVNDSISITVDD